MIFFKKLRNIYSSDNITIQEKAVALFVLDIFLGLGFGALAFVRLAQGEMAKTVLEAVFSIILFILSYMIIKGHFKKSSIITLILMILVGIFLYLQNAIEGRINLFIVGTYFIPIIVTAPLLAYRRWQIFLAIGIVISVLTITFFLQVSPYMTSIGNESAVFDYLVVFILIFLSGLFAYQLFLIQKKSLITIESKMREGEEHFKELSNLIEKTSLAFDVGEQLQLASDKNHEMAEKIGSYLKTMKISMEELLKNVYDSTIATNDISKTKEDVTTQMQEQDNAINVTYSSTEEITTQISTIANSSEAKQQTVNRLVDSSELNKTKLKNTISAFHEVADSSLHVIEVIQVIEEIAERTNLLAMNAAIEAAHAGDSGKGFAVVANEIKKLAEETNKNSRLIRENLEKNNIQVQNSVSETVELQRTFEDLDLNIKQVQEVITEIIATIHELHIGTNSINEATTQLQGSRMKVSDAILGMGESLTLGTARTQGINDTAINVSEQINELTSFAQLILTASLELSSIGEKNMKNFKILQQGMDKIRY